MDRMGCPECGGWVKYITEVEGSFAYPISRRGVIDWDDKDFYGDSKDIVECSECETAFEYSSDREGNIVLDRSASVKSLNKEELIDLVFAYEDYVREKTKDIAAINCPSSVAVFYEEEYKQVKERDSDD